MSFQIDVNVLKSIDVNALKSFVHVTGNFAQGVGEAQAFGNHGTYAVTDTASSTQAPTWGLIGSSTAMSESTSASGGHSFFFHV